MKQLVLTLLLLLTYSNSKACSPADKSNPQYSSKLEEYKKNLLTNTSSITLGKLYKSIGDKSEAQIFILKNIKGTGKETPFFSRWWIAGNGTDCRSALEYSQEYVIFHLISKDIVLMTNNEIKELKIKLPEWEWFYGSDKTIIRYPKI
ncbi:MAG: hypothetical protein HWD86_11500 [Kangiellaceae bacterium]|nr:hypothetical protein [Kangiellaceae bacterium]